MTPPLGVATFAHALECVRAPNPVKLYIKPSCSWCVDAIRYLDQRGYRYERIDVLADPAAYGEMRRISGQSLTPTLDAGGKVLPDFGVDELEVFLRKHGLEPA